MTWGPCLNCEWWQIEPDAKVAKDTLGLCIDEALYPYLLRVSGNSGCNHYMPMKNKNEVARAVGSAAAPPTAKPVR